MFFSQESPLIESLGLKNTNLVNIEARACSFSKEKQGMCEHLFGHIKIIRVFFFFFFSRKICECYMVKFVHLVIYM